MSERIFNFSAGPAILPEVVLKRAQEDLWNVENSGIGVCEHSHRGAAFTKIIEQAEARCRELAQIPQEYKILFLTGGASSQFFQIPMNFLKSGETADYVVTGSWSKKAVKEAQAFGEVHIAASTEEDNFSRIPDSSEVSWSENPTYAHFTSNNTIAGTQWAKEPEVAQGVPLICDASSDIFSRPIDVTRYDMIYCGAQKNLGPAGVTLVIIREDLIEKGADNLPTMLQYRTHAKANSLYNTPPTLPIYLMGEVFQWILDLGGLEAMAEKNQKKAQIIYDYLDQSNAFRAVAQEGSRSLMNICFRGPDEETEKDVIAKATENGFSGLKGHRSVGGLRASVYNAFPEAGCQALVDFLKDYENNL